MFLEKSIKTQIWELVGRISCERTELAKRLKLSVTFINFLRSLLKAFDFIVMTVFLDFPIFLYILFGNECSCYLVKRCNAQNSYSQIVKVVKQSAKSIQQVLILVSSREKGQIVIVITVQIP